VGDGLLAFGDEPAGVSQYLSANSQTLTALLSVNAFVKAKPDRAERGVRCNEHPSSVLIDPTADTARPLADALAYRWSPRAFADRSVSPEDLRTVLEAGRWAASSGNSQPWRYVVARREDADAFAALLACLNEGNQRWAKDAPVLMLAFARRTNDAGKKIFYAHHDLGAASAQMAVQAASMGMQVHQMAGVLKDKMVETVGAPDDMEPMTALVLGWPGEPDTLPEDLEARERAPRTRLPFDAVFFSGTWGEAVGE